MRKVMIDIVDPMLGSRTTASVEEPVQKEYAELNILSYFGIESVTWEGIRRIELPNNKVFIHKYGMVDNCFKLVTIGYVE